jgi:hypothetical protein
MRNSIIAAGIALAIAAMFSLSPSWAAETVKSPDGKCFENTSSGNYEWIDCKKEVVQHKHKG